MRESYEITLQKHFNFLLKSPHYIIYIVTQISSVISYHICSQSYHWNLSLEKMKSLEVFRCKHAPHSPFPRDGDSACTGKNVSQSNSETLSC